MEWILISGLTISVCVASIAWICISGLPYPFVLRQSNESVQRYFLESRLSNFIIGASYNNPTKITPSDTNMDVCYRQGGALVEGGTRSFECSNVTLTRGRYVVIQLQKTEKLTLCEVQVYGYVGKQYFVCFLFIISFLACQGRIGPMDVCA